VVRAPLGISTRYINLGAVVNLAYNASNLLCLRHLRFHHETADRPEQVGEQPLKNPASDRFGIRRHKLQGKLPLAQYLPQIHTCVRNHDFRDILRLQSNK